jgi:membrane associated rhomboid family serine protease
MEEHRNPFHGIGSFFRSGSSLSILILINILVWMIISFIRVPLFLSRVPDQAVIDNVLDWLAIPANPATLLQHPWTVVTYMFLHVDFLHILFNLLWLFWFGKIFLEYLDGRKLTMVYLLGGIAGGLLYVLFFNIFPVFEEQRSVSFALGASAAVMAVVSAVSFYNPSHSVFFVFIGRLKIIYIFALLFILDFFLIRSDNSGGHIAHIGGAIFGILYATFIRQGNNVGELKDSFRRKSYMRARPGGASRRKKADEGADRPLTDEEYNIVKAERKKKMDEILDKISRSGYESLTRAEKEFLFRESQR